MHSRELEYPRIHVPGASAQLSLYPNAPPDNEFCSSAPIKYQSHADKPTTFCEVKICKPLEHPSGLVPFLHEYLW
jgi:hypothetical protein